MKKILILIFVISISCCAIAQQTGVQFIHGLNWTEIKAKAKAENKYIFVDCFTTWCGPCRMVSTQIFPLEEVGSFFNKNFINVKSQMDKTSGDTKDIKSWYSDADTIAKIGKVVNYPTFLYFNPDGELVHRQVGAPLEPKEFVECAKAALNPSTQYVTLKRKYESTPNPDLSLLHNVAIAFSGNADTQNGEEEKGQLCADEFISKSELKDLLKKENIDFMKRFTRNPQNKGFEVFRKHGAAIDSVVGQKISEAFVVGILYYNEIPKLIQGTPNWANIKDSIQSKYPEFSDLLVAKARIDYFGEQKKWESFINEVENRFQLKNGKPSKEELNGYAWAIFSSCKDVVYLSKALKWSEIALKEDALDISSLANYANMLYMLKKNQAAIKYMQKAVSLSAKGSEERTSLEDLLDKMKKHQKISF